MAHLGIDRRLFIGGMLGVAMAPQMLRAADTAADGAINSAANAAASPGPMPMVESLHGTGINPALLSRARAAMDRLGAMVTARDRIGIVDFSQVSRTPRFSIVDMASGTATTILVAHGRGSDPDHKGWVERFSNEPGSNASSQGSYITGAYYEGKHGPSRRLNGMDAENNNAEMRAIVIHAADYVGPGIVAMQGRLGRSEGCFAVAQSNIAMLLDRLGEGRLLYADRI